MMDLTYLDDVLGISAREATLVVVCVTSTLAIMLAWVAWGRPLWEKKMSKRQRERDEIKAVTEHIAGALEYMLKDRVIEPKRLWNILFKLDGQLPGLRQHMLPIFQKYLTSPEMVPDEPKEALTIHKLRSLLVLR